jgi:cytochrome c553
MFSQYRRTLAFGLAAAALCIGSTSVQSATLAERIQVCASCHGEEGNSHIEKVPSLAGQQEFRVLMQLILMREGVRKIEAMAPIVKDMKDDEVDALAKYFARLPPKSSGEPIDPALVRRGAEIAARKNCVSCHLPTFVGHQQIPRLAKQRIDYLIQALTELRDSKRSGADTLMNGAVTGLSDADLTALAHYAASR